VPDAANVAAPTFEAAARLTLALRTCSFLGKAFSNFLDRRVCRFFRARTKTRLALRTRGVSRTTSLIPENKNRTTSCEAVKDKHSANGAVDPECRANPCLNKTASLPSAWQRHAGRRHGWMACECIQKGIFGGSRAQQLLKNPGSIAAVAFEPARYD